jgi:hypothetical protein
MYPVGKLRKKKEKRNNFLFAGIFMAERFLLREDASVLLVIISYLWLKEKVRIQRKTNTIFLFAPNLLTRYRQFFLHSIHSHQTDKILFISKQSSCTLDFYFVKP